VSEPSDLKNTLVDQTRELIACYSVLLLDSSSDGGCDCPCVSRDGRLMGVLEVSRSVGDGAFKMHGVSSTPDVKKCQLSSNDRSVSLSQCVDCVYTV